MRDERDASVGVGGAAAQCERGASVCGYSLRNETVREGGVS